MMNIKEIRFRSALLAGCLFFFMVPAHLYAQDDGWGKELYIGVSSIGATVGLAQYPTRNIRIKTGPSLFYYSLKADKEHNGRTVNTAVNLAMFDWPVIFEWLPFEKIFSIDAGLVLSFNSIGIVTTPKNARTFGDISVSPQDQGELRTNISYNNFSPYLGMGLGNISSENTVNVGLDIGVMYQGAPKVVRTATGMFSVSDGQTKQLEDALVKHTYLSIYPVVSLTVALRIGK
jgi:hypothetical protein